MPDSTTLELIGFLYPPDWVPRTDSQGREVPVHLDHADGSLHSPAGPLDCEELALWDGRGHFQRTPDESGDETDLEAVLAGSWVPDGRSFRSEDQGPLPYRGPKQE